MIKLIEKAHYSLSPQSPGTGIAIVNTSARLRTMELDRNQHNEKVIERFESLKKHAKAKEV